MTYNNARLHTWGPSVTYPRGRPNDGSELDRELDHAYESLNDLHSRLLAGITNSPTWSETDTAPTAAQVAARISQAISDLLDGAPDALDTLKELAAALGDDANFAATITNALADRYLKTEIDAFFEGVTIGGKKQVDWQSITNKPVSINTLGTIGMYIEPVAPIGVIYFQGTTVSRTIYPELWQWVTDNNLIDNTNPAAFGGGDSSTTFTVPDWRGIFVRGGGIHSTLKDYSNNLYNGGGILEVKLDAIAKHKHAAGNGWSITGLFGVDQSMPLIDNLTGDPVSARTATETRPVSVAINWGISYE